MRPAFRDPKLQEQFQLEGYIVVDLMSPDDVEHVIKMYNDFIEHSKRVTSDIGKTQDYELTFFDSNEDKKKLLEEVNDFFKEKVDKYLLDYKPLITNIFCKEPGKGEVPVHQNWTFVDESKYASVSVWIPLVPVNRTNGILEVVPRTHRSLTGVRGPTIPWVFQDLFSVIKEKYMQEIEVKLGQAMILDDAILHYSSENHSDFPRTAVQLIMIPEDAQAIHYYKDPASKDNKVEVFEVDYNWYLNFNAFNKRPEGAKSLGFIEYDYKNLTEQEFRQKLGLN